MRQWEKKIMLTRGEHFGAEYDKRNSNCSDTCIKAQLEVFHKNCKDNFVVTATVGAPKDSSTRL